MTDVLIRYILTGFLITAVILYVIDSPYFRKKNPHLFIQMDDPLNRMIVACLCVFLWPFAIIAAGIYGDQI